MLKPIIQDRILFPNILWQRPVNIYQRRGSVCILGGEKDIKKTLLLADVLYQSGIKKISLGYPDALKDVYQKLLPDEFHSPLPSTQTKTLSFSVYDKIKEMAKSYDLLIIGVGLSQNQETQRLVRKLLELDIPIFINTEEILNPDDINGSFTNRILKIKTIYPNPIFNIQKLASKMNKILVSNNQEVFVAQKGEIIITHTKIQDEIFGGLISAFWSQNIKKPFESACTGAYIAKIWQKNFANVLDIPKAIEIAEKEIERR